MNKNKKIHFVIPLLVLIPLIIAIISISSYIDTVTSNMEITDDIIDHNYMLYNQYVKDYANSKITGAIGTTQYISTQLDKLTANEDGKFYDFSPLHLESQSSAFAPKSAEFFSPTEFSDIYGSSSNKSFKKIYELTKSSGALPCLHHYKDDKLDGFFILYPKWNKETFLGVTRTYYPADEFIKAISYNDPKETYRLSIFPISGTTFYTYNNSDNKVICNATENLLKGSNIKDKSDSDKTNQFQKLIVENKEGEYKWTDPDSQQEYQVFFSPMKGDNYNAIGLYTFLNIENKFGITEDISSYIHSKGLTLIFTLLVIFIAIFVTIILLHNYYNRAQTRYYNTLFLEKERYTTLINNTTLKIWEYNYKTATIIGINTDDSSGELMPIAQYKLRVQRNEIIHPDDFKIFLDFIQVIENGGKEINGQLRIKISQNEYAWYEIKGSTIYDAQNNPVNLIISGYNIDIQKKQLDYIQSTAEKDGLTRLFNLTAMHNKVDEIINDQSSSFMHAMLLIDIENLAILSEKFGATFCDAILLNFASKLYSIVNPHDLAGRVQGNTFILFLYNIPSFSYIDEIAIKITNIFDELTNTLEGTDSITGSIGATYYPIHGGTFETLYVSADKALTSAKKLKQNYCIYSDELESIHTGTNYSTLFNTDNTTTDLSNHTIIDNDIVYSVVEILFKSKEFNASISMALSMICNYYDFDQIGIIDYTEDNAQANCNHSWSNSRFERFSRQIINLPTSVEETIALYKNTVKGIFYTNDVESLNIEPSCITDIIKCAEINSIFQCAITDNGQLKGYLFAHSINKVEWEGHIADTLNLLTQIISGYLIKQRTQEDVYKLTQTDILTGSNNLFAFISKATTILEENPLQRFATVYMDIDRFKLINDKYGFSVGDHVLIDFASIISKNLRNNEIYGRIDADKFVLFMKFMGMSEFDNRIMSLFNEVSSHLREDIGYRASLIGGVYIIRDKIDISAAIDRANLARKSIKDHHHSTYEIFNESMKSSIVIKNDIETAMESAIEHEEFKVYYQPKFNIFTNTIYGSEALVRWERPGYGLVSPGLFIPIFEDNGFIAEVDFYVFDKVCALMRELMDKGIKVYPVSVNFSRVHLNNDKIIKRLISVVGKYDISPSLIEVEITESAFSEGDDFTPALLNEIRRLGFKLSMDDFGSGLSSLNSLRKFPFDILKLDKDFFNKEGISEKEKLVVANIVNLAKQLNMSVIAEGIETEEQAEFLRSIDSPIVQGFLYSKPIPQDQFVKDYLL